MTRTNAATSDEAPQTDHSETEYVFRWICEACNTTSEMWFETDDLAFDARDAHVEDNDECYQLWAGLQRWPRDEAADYSWPNFQVASDDPDE